MSCGVIVRTTLRVANHILATAFFEKIFHAFSRSPLLVTLVNFCCTELLEQSLSWTAWARFIRFAEEPYNKQIYTLGCCPKQSKRRELMVSSMSVSLLIVPGSWLHRQDESAFLPIQSCAVQVLHSQGRLPADGVQPRNSG